LHKVRQEEREGGKKEERQGGSKEERQGGSKDYRKLITILIQIISSKYQPYLTLYL
jgi:hypothetical protein